MSVGYQQRISITKKHIIHTKQTDPIHNHITDGKHVTLIGCIAADDEFVEPSYIIPYPLLNKKTIVRSK